MEPKTSGPHPKSGRSHRLLQSEVIKSTFCLLSIQSVPERLFPSCLSWYKDNEQILSSVPGYIVMKDRDLRIVANEFNEGVYTCRIHRRGEVVSANSWLIRLKPEQPSNS